MKLIWNLALAAGVFARVTKVLDWIARITRWRISSRINSMKQCDKIKLSCTSSSWKGLMWDLWEFWDLWDLIYSLLDDFENINIWPSLTQGQLGDLPETNRVDPGKLGAWSRWVVMVVVDQVGRFSLEIVSIVDTLRQWGVNSVDFQTRTLPCM